MPRIMIMTDGQDSLTFATQTRLTNKGGGYLTSSMRRCIIVGQGTVYHRFNTFTVHRMVVQQISRMEAIFGLERKCLSLFVPLQLFLRFSELLLDLSSRIPLQLEQSLRDKAKTKQGDLDCSVNGEEIALVPSHD